tara:strand:+ start:352 stop:510 length:159 start_codon:yes stop_codon:yes gene_type:complete
MISKNIKGNKSNKFSLEKAKSSEYCKVSNASNEIMLDRFYGGKSIEFPFQDN